jgi:hypothetical protein
MECEAIIPINFIHYKILEKNQRYIPPLKETIIYNFQLQDIYYGCNRFFGENQKHYYKQDYKIDYKISNCELCMNSVEFDNLKEIYQFNKLYYDNEISNRLKDINNELILIDEFSNLIKYLIYDFSCDNIDNIINNKPNITIKKLNNINLIEIIKNKVNIQNKKK